MGHINADAVLPAELLREVQRHIDGAYLYVPRRTEMKRKWGEKTGITSALRARNREIAAKRREGRTVAQLAAEYFLSDKTVSRIVANTKH